MDCMEVRPLLSAYYDGEVAPEEYARVHRHLANCQECRHVLAEYRAIGGGIRALPVPVPPTGLRREVWRTIESRQPARGASIEAPARGNVTALRDRERPQEQAPAVKRGWTWGKVLPAAGLVAATLLIALVAVLLANRPRMVAAAQLAERPPFSDYNQVLHVQFNKTVVGQDAVRQTTVRMLQPDQLTLDDSAVEKRYDGAGRQLIVTPKQPWTAGARYEITVDAPNISRGVGNETLAAEPIKITFETAAHTPTPTSTPTDTPTFTPTMVPTSTPLPTDTPEPTAVAEVPGPVENTPTTETKPSATTQPKPPATNTRVPSTATSTVAPTRTATPAPTNTVAPSATPTQRGTATPTPAPPTATRTPVPPKPTQTLTPRPSATLTPRITATPRVSPSPTPPCSVMPENGFGKLYRENATVRAALGCPLQGEVPITQAADQHFQGGYMFWNGLTRTIYVFLGDGSGNWFSFPDTWVETAPTPDPAGTPPAGLYAPVRGFGKLWQEYPALRQSLGWATDQEGAVTGAWQAFDKGSALWTSDRLIRVLYDTGSFTRHPDTYVAPTPTRRAGE